MIQIVGVLVAVSAVANLILWGITGKLQLGIIGILGIDVVLYAVTLYASVG